MKVFDSHFHIIDTRFPLIANSGYLPQPFTTEDYLKKVNDLHVLGGAVVSGSFQAFDPKATGFGRVNFDVIEMMKKITAVNPDCLMFGTDLPSTRAPRPFTTTDLSLIINHFNALQAEKILFSNAVDFYGVTNLKM